MYLMTTICCVTKYDKVKCNLKTKEKSINKYKFMILFVNQTRYEKKHFKKDLTYFHCLFGSFIRPSLAKVLKLNFRANLWLNPRKNHKTNFLPIVWEFHLQIQILRLYLEAAWIQPNRQMLSHPGPKMDLHHFPDTVLIWVSLWQ